MTDARLAELKRLAEAALECDPSKSWFNSQELAGTLEHTDNSLHPDIDAAYIAACSPERITGLIGRLEAAERGNMYRAGVTGRLTARVIRGLCTQPTDSTVNDELRALRDERDTLKAENERLREALIRALASREKP